MSIKLFVSLLMIVLLGCIKKDVNHPIEDLEAIDPISMYRLSQCSNNLRENLELNMNPKDFDNLDTANTYISEIPLMGVKIFNIPFLDKDRSTDFVSAVVHDEDGYMNALIVHIEETSSNRLYGFDGIISLYAIDRSNVDHLEYYQNEHVNPPSNYNVVPTPNSSSAYRVTTTTISTTQMGGYYAAIWINMLNFFGINNSDYFTWIYDNEGFIYWGSGGMNNGDNPNHCQGSPILPVLQEPTFLLQLVEDLQLDNMQAGWLLLNDKRAEELYFYLLNSSQNIEDSKIIAREHINEMMSNPGYLSFVVNHDNTSLNQNVWWEDANWLEDPNNFNFDLQDDQILRQLTTAELILCTQFPIQAVQIFNNIDNAFNMSNNMMGTSGLHSGHNDKKDAFRHSYFNAINTRDVKPRYPLFSSSTITGLFGEAHESEVPQQLQLEKQMVF